jgi:hypothetical protein
MDEKWMEQAGQDRRMVEDQAWLFRDWVVERTGQQRDMHGDVLVPKGKARWIMKRPALIIFPVLGFGACFWLFVIGLLAGW